jgi:hypothetical protein
MMVALLYFYTILSREAYAKSVLEIEMFGNAIVYKDAVKPGKLYSKLMTTRATFPSTPWWVWFFIDACSLLPLFFYVEVYSACIALVAIALCITVATFLNVDTKYRALVCTGISIACGLSMYCTILLMW